MKIDYKLSDDENSLLLCFSSDTVLYELQTSPPEFQIERLFKSEVPTVWSMGEFNELFLDDQAYILKTLKDLRKNYAN